MPSGFGQVPDL